MKDRETDVKNPTSHSEFELRSSSSLQHEILFYGPFWFGR